ncbi:hypothetical protein KUTeg_007752 [Tegillarca granosa]|uniref:histone deacetylase n=1 Tax=Tegillarca granosa TaxID=220873 RepID=A0ABQ9FGF1_TEGGR|nr:hypothetical protein KUTeg_007752 [Tegillarca granosa]
MDLSPETMKVHVLKDSASGFCYINDIVLGILKLREKYERILYVDLDLHHGDGKYDCMLTLIFTMVMVGVEEAFSVTSKVLTFSVHKYAPGFFPGSGKLENIGYGKGKYYTVNIPLMDGVRDSDFIPLVCRLLQKVRDVYKPEAVVCQCGADGLAGDPTESFNLTHLALGRCVYFILSWGLKTLLLGGGKACVIVFWKQITVDTCMTFYKKERENIEFFFF